MTFTLEVDQHLCIRCSKCVRVCPAAIFRQENPKAEVMVCHPENCIACGHCAAVCPTDAVRHSLFPPETIHAIDRTQLPTPEQLMLLIKARRSNRAFSRKPVPEEYVDQIIEAAYRSPTASNKQELAFVYVSDPQKLQQIIQFTVDVFDEKLRNINRPVVRTVVNKITPTLYKMASRMGALVQMVKEGKDPILRGATSALFIYSDRENKYYGKIDGNLAYQNASLMAESLGVSQFYTGFVCRAIGEDKKGRINEILEIDGVIHAGMGLGMPSFLYPNYMDKKEIIVKKIL